MNRAKSLHRLLLTPAGTALIQAGRASCHCSRALLGASKADMACDDDGHVF